MAIHQGECDPIRAIRGDFFENKSLREMLSMMFKGKMANFPNDPFEAGF